MRTRLRRLYYRIFKRYRRLELRCLEYPEADRLLRECAGRPEAEQWELAIPEEDRNRNVGIVFLERRERIVG